METEKNVRLSEETMPKPDHRLDDWLIATYLAKEGETVEEAKKRLKEKAGTNTV